MRRLLAAAVVAVLALRSGNAVAQDDPRKLQAAPLFEEGRKLAEQGRNAESLERFRRAYELYPSPNTQFNVARQEQILGQRLAALRDYREALRNPVLLPQLASMARGFVADLEQSLARVKVVGPEGARVKVGDREYTLPHDAPIDVEPGMTEVKGIHGAEHLTAVVEAHAGTLTVAELREKRVGSAIDVSPPNPSTERWGTGQYVGLGLVAAGVVSLGAGVGFAVARGNSSDDLDRLAPFTGSNGELCAGGAALRQCADFTEKQDERDRNGALSTTFLVGGAVLLVAGVVTFFVLPKRSSASSGAVVRPLVTARMRGFELRF